MSTVFPRMLSKPERDSCDPLRSGPPLALMKYSACSFMLCLRLLERRFGYFGYIAVAAAIGETHC
jgi:hypothetical protein